MGVQVHGVTASVELQKVGVESLHHSNWCVCIQQHDNGRVGGERWATSLLL